MAAFLFLASKREARDTGKHINSLFQGSRGDPKKVKKLVKELLKES